MTSKFARSGMAARQVILLLILLVVAGAGAYEFLVARPAYEKAWKAISEIDSSVDSNNFTSEEIEEMIDRQPAASDDSIPNLEIRTYCWQSGIPWRPHAIHVVYTRVLPEIAEKSPELMGKRYYYSATGGTQLTSENLPAEKQTTVYDRNKRYGAVAGMGNQPPPQNGDDDEEGDDEDGGDTDADDSTDSDADADGDAADDGADMPADESSAESADDADEGDADASESGGEDSDSGDSESGESDSGDSDSGDSEEPSDAGEESGEGESGDGDADDSDSGDSDSGESDSGDSGDDN